jgi:SH3-like domain-containing protein
MGRVRLPALGMQGASLAALLCVIWAADASGQGGPAGVAPQVPQASGLPVPRYVSLKSDKVHLRQGPGTDHKVLWVYRRAGLPVEVIKEFDGWRQVRDAEGATGWVIQTLVSGRRTALVLPWEVKAKPLPEVALLADDAVGSRTIAIVEAGVIASIRTCDGKWCFVAVGDYRGYIEQKKLWGVYENEIVK